MRQLRKGVVPEIPGLTMRVKDMCEIAFNYKGGGTDGPESLVGPAFSTQLVRRHVGSAGVGTPLCDRARCAR